MSHCPSFLANSVLYTLNSALDRDPYAMRNLVFARVPCNDELACHPVIQCPPRKSSRTEVGFLGVLNGILLDAAESLGLTPTLVVAEFGEDGMLVKFSPAGCVLPKVKAENCATRDLEAPVAVLATLSS